ncbi:MAG: transporter related protein [Conexibacter sp.]|nr:transporter related protein [Conexibacter sp.]
MSGPGAAVLELERLTYTYPGAATPALDDVSLRVDDGEFVILAGRSGGGKSTLLRAGSGLVPHFHGGEIAGRLTVAGMDVREHGPGDLAVAVGSLFQDPETQVVMGTVRSELAFPLENRGESAAAIARGVEEAALALGLAHLLDRPTHELSGGELQRVALGAALAGRPRLVLLDEPTSQLDPVAGDELIGLLRRLNEEWGTAVVLAEHRLERCLTAADRVIALVEGRVACDASPQAFLAWANASAPALETPGARLLAGAGLGPPPVGVKAARATLRAHGGLPDAPATSSPPTRDADARADSAPADGARADSPRRSRPWRRGAATGPAALRFRDVWHEPRDRPAILRAVELRLAAGERVALMGRNGAGKSTLLRHAAGLLEPTRGRIERAGRVALLLQNPNDYLVHERVADEAPAEALAAAGLAAYGERHPRDLSGGERQRLALAIVLGAGDPPAVLCLDEPTRGMDRAHKADLAVLLGRFAATGTALLVATHDPEFAAAFADRVVLLGDGTPIADDAAAEILAGGWYFATETARILRGAGGVLDPDAGAALIRAQLAATAADAATAAAATATSAAPAREPDSLPTEVRR